MRGLILRLRWARGGNERMRLRAATLGLSPAPGEKPADFRARVCRYLEARRRWQEPLR